MTLYVAVFFEYHDNLMYGESSISKNPMGAVVQAETEAYEDFCKRLTAHQDALSAVRDRRGRQQHSGVEYTLYPIMEPRS